MGTLSHNARGNFSLRFFLFETLKRNSQITQDTFHGIRKDGEDETAGHHQWWNDVFPNLYFDDRLWAHMIQGAEWLRVIDRTKINNASLLLLLCMGILDWKAPNNCLHQATQVIRHGTAIVLRLLPVRVFASTQ